MTYDDVEPLRARYRSTKIKVLFVGESALPGARSCTSKPVRFTANFAKPLRHTSETGRPLSMPSNKRASIWMIWCWNP